MYEPYYDSKQERWRRGLRFLRGAALGTGILVGVIGGAQTATARGVIGAAMIVYGILAVSGGDRYGLTESRSGVARAIGWAITLIACVAIVVGGWLLMMEK
jgi:hypothetical protein